MDARGLKVTAAQRERIVTCTDLTQLQDWITRAVSVTKAADIFA